MLEILIMKIISMKKSQSTVFTSFLEYFSLFSTCNVPTVGIAAQKYINSPCKYFLAGEFSASRYCIVLCISGITIFQNIDMYHTSLD